jgi:Cof subfamily protein (haloacid dehalogenase superfamily)
MANIKLAALDVDGTLVRSDLSLSQPVARAVESLRDAGVVVSVVTGRSLGELIHFRRQFPWIRYFVVSNGATGYDAETNQTFYENHLPIAVAQEIEREARNYPVMTQVYADGTSYLNQSSWEQTERYTAEHMHHPSLEAGYTPVEHIGDFLTARKNDIEKLYVSFEDLSDLPRLRTFCERFSVDLVTSIHNGLEITQKAVEKGTGLIALCEYLGISPEETAAVGDGLADIAMFRHAGLSIAMENALDDVKSAATFVAPSNNDDGAVWAIRQILNAKQVCFH